MRAQPHTAVLAPGVEIFLLELLRYHLLHLKLLIATHIASGQHFHRHTADHFFPDLFWRADLG